VIVVALLPVLAGAGALALAVLTGLGEHRRGASLPVDLVAGLFFPITWFAWYFRDERAHHRAE
jgi:hypothetical protein